jgi:hypothetical protein
MEKETLMKRSGKRICVGLATAVVALLCLADTSFANGKGHGVSGVSYSMIGGFMTLTDAQAIIGHHGREMGKFKHPKHGLVITWIWGDAKRNIRVYLVDNVIIGKDATGIHLSRPNPNPRPPANAKPAPKGKSRPAPKR